MLRLLLAIVPFVRELFTENEDLDDMVTSHRSLTLLTILVMVAAGITGVMFIHLRDREYELNLLKKQYETINNELLIRESRFKDRSTELQQLYTEKMQVKDSEIDTLRKHITTLESTLSKCN